MNQIKSILFALLLVLIPYLPLSELYFGDQIQPVTFLEYVGFSCFIGLLMIVILALLNRWFLMSSYSVKYPAILLFILGIIIMFPLHLGAPRQNETLISSAGIEKIRYTTLAMAVFTFYLAIFLYLRNFWHVFNAFDKAIVLPLIVALPILVWDNYSSFMLSEELKLWISDGHVAKEFENHHDFKENWRAAGRILLYVSILWFIISLVRHHFIKRWKAIVLALFCLVGIGFCFAFVFADPNLYFPFMVPAVVLAPAYWAGLALLTEHPES